MNTRSRPERRGYDKILYEQHLERVSSVKHVIDTSAPRQHPFNHRSLRERIAKLKRIDVDNMHILQRIANAIQDTRIDNKLDTHINEYSKFTQRLYHVVHQSRLKQITDENLNLLKRIQTVKPVYSAAQMEMEYKKKQEIMKQMCIY